MARIPYFNPSEATPEQIKALAGKRAINIFRMIANSENAGIETLALGQKLSRGSSLDHTLREVVILRVGYLSKAEYELDQHRKVAKRVGLTDDLIEAIGQYPETDFEFEPTHEDFLKFTDAVVKETRPSDEVFDCVTRQVNRSQLVELVLLIGFYMMVSRVMNTFDLELETGDTATWDIKLDEVKSN